MKQKRNRFYLGYVRRESGIRFAEVFTSRDRPTVETTGHRYALVIGPFKTLAGCDYMRLHGDGNSQCSTVAEAERLAHQPKDH